MPDTPSRRRQFLFVDDDSRFLAGIRQVFTEMSRGTWEIHTAGNHAHALALLQKQRVDVVVLDLDMPVMDGLQFLKLLGRTHPGQQVVILTGRASEEKRKACLENGAAMFLEKLIAPEGFTGVFAALDALAGSLPQEGFRGMMRRVGLPEVLQMECLGRKSSVLEVFTSKVRGRIFIHEGSIIHAESGTLQGEVALYGLLGLRGGEFNLQSFAEPPRRTINSHYEFLLMEAARLHDEGTSFFEDNPAAAEPEKEQPPVSPSATSLDSSPGYQTVPTAWHPASGAPSPVEVAEVVLCSGAGEVLHDWQCRSLDRRLELLAQVEQEAGELSALLPTGRFDRLEIVTAEGRVVCQIQPHMRLFVRSVRSKTVA